jgi:hypothetical protein
MCAVCKKYGLDHSTISADLNYCLHEESSEKVCFNGVRDPICKERAGRKLDYLVELPEAVNTGMTKAEAGALLFYSSHSTRNVSVRRGSRAPSTDGPGARQNWGNSVL